MASGRKSAQEKNFRPGNSHTAVNQARLTPSSVAPTATPRASQNVLITRSASVVSTRCCQTSPVGAKSDDMTVPTGISTSAATRKGIRRQPDEARLVKAEKLEKPFLVLALFAVASSVPSFTPLT